MLRDALDYRGRNLVFIVGAPRSGTTWLQRLIASHPDFRTGQESLLFSHYIVPQMRTYLREVRKATELEGRIGRGGVGLSCYLAEFEFRKILRNYLIELLQPMIADLGPNQFFIEKSTDHSFCLLDIFEMLPDCKIIHILRDPRDVVSSIVAASRSWGKRWAPSSAQVGAKIWLRHYNAINSARRGIPSEQYHQLTYETLMTSTISTMRGVFRFLGIEWGESELANAIDRNRPDVAARFGTKIPLGGEIRNISGDCVREPEGFVRKATPGAWRSDLSWIQKLQVWGVAHETMKLAGYKWDYPWQ
jgi:hypothetical protein